MAAGGAGAGGAAAGGAGAGVPAEVPAVSEAPHFGQATHFGSSSGARQFGQRAGANGSGWPQ